MDGGSCVYDHALDPGLLRLANANHLMPISASCSGLASTIPGEVEAFPEKVDSGGTAVVEQEVMIYAETARGRVERDARRRDLFRLWRQGKHGWTC